MTSSTFFQRRRERFLIGLKITDAPETLDFSANSNFAYSSELQTMLALQPKSELYAIYLSVIFPSLKKGLKGSTRREFQQWYERKALVVGMPENQILKLYAK
ncbi:MAG: hypothetical protein RL226_1124 [Bacteroidota bacterium]|jgi:hypothetical protein